MKLLCVCEATWSVFAVCTTRGDCHLYQFLEGLPANMEVHSDGLFALFDRIKINGPQHLSSDKSHQLDGEIWEFIRGRIRVLWFYGSPRRKMIVCSHGFLKATKRTPRAHIERAKANCEQFQAAVENDALTLLGEGTV